MLSPHLVLLEFCLLPTLATLSQTPDLERRAVNCLRVGVTAMAKWTNGAGRTCTFLGVVGGNYGANRASSGDGGVSDLNCGAAYNAAIDDTAFRTLNGLGIRTLPIRS
ncbi:hypothetical protein EDB80DRAFT_688780 [Ilyonectria destructans]|nr:hypothetical protein EDB80DRAFT_688780 [Ilyonectria destructans]